MLHEQHGISKSLASPLFVQQLVQGSNFCWKHQSSTLLTPLWGEMTYGSRFHTQRVSNVESISMSWYLHVYDMLLARDPLKYKFVISSVWGILLCRQNGPCGLRSYDKMVYLILKWDPAFWNHTNDVILTWCMVSVLSKYLNKSRRYQTKTWKITCRASLIWYILNKNGWHLADGIFLVGAQYVKLPCIHVCAMFMMVGIIGKKQHHVSTGQTSKSCASQCNGYTATYTCKAWPWCYLFVCWIDFRRHRNVLENITRPIVHIIVSWSNPNG